MRRPCLEAARGLVITSSCTAHSAAWPRRHAQARQPTERNGRGERRGCAQGVHAWRDFCKSCGAGRTVRPWKAPRPRARARSRQCRGAPSAMSPEAQRSSSCSSCVPRRPCRLPQAGARRALSRPTRPAAARQAGLPCTARAAPAHSAAERHAKRVMLPCHGRVAACLSHAHPGGHAQAYPILHAGEQALALDRPACRL